MKSLLHSPNRTDISKLLNAAFVLTIMFFMSSCGQEKQHSAVQPDCTTLTAENADDCIRLNQIQVLGTHNSYKLDLPETLIEAVNTFLPGWSENIEYGHRPLSEQLELLGIRQFEIDIFADPEGGLFARPQGALMSGDSLFIDREEMLEPGYKVLHVQDIDYRSVCLTFVSCLEEVREWSIANPTHLPIMILVELKDSQATSRGEFALTQPVEITASMILDVDQEILSVFDRSHLIMPDDVRGEFETLEQAVTEAGWPTLAQSRGKILFALDNTGRHRDDYISHSEDLSGLVMFPSSAPGEPTAGFIKMNNVLADAELIRSYVEQGFIIRTRSDIPNQEARSGDTTRRDLALASGAQYVSTDYPEVSPFGSGFIVTLPGAEGPGICNPVNAPEGCHNSWIVE